jgi:hypothetical protein
MRPWRASLGLALILTLAAACTPPPEPEGPRIETADDLLAALREAGVAVAEITMSMPELPRGRVVILGSERVEIYEEDSEAARRAAVQDLLQHTASESTPNLWGRGRVVVIYDGLDGPTIALLSGLLGDSVGLPAPAPDEPYPPAVASAIGWLAQETEANPGEVIVETFEESEWPDACLGLPGPEEVCAAVITSGWRVTLRLGDESYVLRSDDLGSTIRREP